MLEVPANNARIRSAKGSGPVDAIDMGGALREIAQGLLRQWAVIAASVLAMLILAVLYVLTATPLFTARSSIIIDPRVSNTPNAQPAQTLLLSDALVVDSEVEVLRSRELANRVIDQLGLLANPNAFEKASPIGTLAFAVRRSLETVFLSNPDEDETLDPLAILAARREAVLRNLAGSLEIARAGDTYVIDVSFTSDVPGFAAKIANTVTDQYFLLQADAVYENTRRISDWLSERVLLLGQQVVAADRAVEEYKKANNVFIVQDGRLPSEAELSTASDQLIALRGQILDLEAAIGQLNSIVAGNQLNASVDAAVRTATLTTLQQQYSELTGRERDLSARFGAAHQLARRARDEIAATRAQIVEELGKIAAAEKSRLNILQVQAAESSTRIERLREQASADAQKMIRLRELDREAASSRTLYETLLAKRNETTQAESFRSLPARVIAKAVPPDRKSAPRSKVVLALGVLGGLVIGCGIAFIREQLDDVFRKSTSVEDDLAIPLLGVVPLFSIDKRMIGRRRKRFSSAAAARAVDFGASRKIAKQARPYRFAVDNPTSLFSETLRSVSFAIDMERARDRANVVGIASVFSGDGKSTLAANLAAYLSSVGNRVALIDFDLRNPTLTTLMGSGQQDQTLDNILRGDVDFTRPETDPILEGAVFIGNGGETGSFNPSHIASFRAFETLIETLRATNDMIILDMPPLASVVDAKIAAEVTDHIVLAIEWGKTHRTAARNTIDGNHKIRRKLAGAVYMKVKLSAYDKYNSDGGGRYDPYPD